MSSDIEKRFTYLDEMITFIEQQLSDVITICSCDRDYYIDTLESMRLNLRIIKKRFDNP